MGFPHPWDGSRDPWGGFAPSWVSSRKICSLFPGKELGKGWDPKSRDQPGKKFPAGIQGWVWDRICCVDMEDPGSGVIPTPFPSEVFPLFIFPGCSPVSQRSQGLYSLHSMGLGTGSSSCSCSGLNSHCDPWDQTQGEIRDFFPKIPIGMWIFGESVYS